MRSGWQCLLTFGYNFTGENNPCQAFSAVGWSKWTAVIRRQKVARRSFGYNSRGPPEAPYSRPKPGGYGAPKGQVVSTIAWLLDDIFYHFQEKAK
jgi:hypothetical protein